MTKRNEIYKCEVCGNIVEVVHEAGGQLVCCGQPMKLLDEKIQDQGQEKHIPIIEKTESGIKVKVGFIEHPMTEEHYIEWIEIKKDNKLPKKFLKPGEKPEAEFCIKERGIEARAYCNLHGLWKSKNQKEVKMESKKNFTEQEAKEIGEQLMIKWDKFDVDQFKRGMDVELEHGTIDSNTNVSNDDPLITGKITLAHLNEIQDYYDRLEKMEKEGEAYWEQKEAE